MIRRLCAALLLVLSAPLWAHKPSDSYLTLHLDRPAAGPEAVRLDLALRDLDFALGLDADADGRVTWGELRQAQTRIAAYVLSRLDLSRGGARCPAALRRLMFTRHVDGGYAVLMLDPACTGAAPPDRVDYRLFFDVDSLHRAIVVFAGDGREGSIVLGDERRVARVPEHAGPGGWTSFLIDGIRHIWIGYDHILFLISLLLPSVLVRQEGRWRPAPGYRETLRDAIGIVTAFTAAHSITLTLAAGGWLNLPSRLVESAIALSVALAAANNLYPVVHRRRIALTFAFGLIHGFGFAGVLSGLGLGTGSRLAAIAGFNLGVEIGQLAIVLAVLPLAFALRRTRAYLEIGLRMGSLAIVALAGVWLAERAFDLRLITAGA